jgi:hypothetical protein
MQAQCALYGVTADLLCCDSRSALELLSNRNDLLLLQQYSTTIRAAALYVRVQASGNKKYSVLAALLFSIIWYACAHTQDTQRRDNLKSVVVLLLSSSSNYQIKP